MRKILKGFFGGLILWVKIEKKMTGWVGKGWFWHCDAFENKNFIFVVIPTDNGKKKSAYYAVSGGKADLAEWPERPGILKTKQRKTRCTMNKSITKSVKVAVTASALAVALTGCCMFGSDDCCKEPCKCCCEKKCCGKKTSGVNTSMTVGVGTDGIRVGSDANVGNRSASANANASVGANGVTAGAGGGVS